MKIQTITTGNLNNDTYILSQNNSCIIIDASAPLNELIKETAGQKVLAIFLTHGHYDHIVYIDEIIKHFNVNCYIHKNELEKLYSPELNYSPVFNTTKVCSTPKNKFILLEDETHFNLGEFDIQTFLTKGHTNGSICLEINGKLFTGDTLLHWSCGRTDLLTGSEEEMIKSLKFLKQKYLGWEYYSGHGKKGIVL